jgi:hypothetical protein
VGAVAVIIAMEDLRYSCAIKDKNMVDAAINECASQKEDRYADAMLFQPKQKFPGLSAELRGVLSLCDNIYRLYLLHAQRPGDREPYWLILVDFEGDQAVLFPAIEKLIRPHMRPGDTIEIIKAPHSLLQKASNNCRPVYSKLRLVY